MKLHCTTRFIYNKVRLVIKYSEQKIEDEYVMINSINFNKSTECGCKKTQGHNGDKVRHLIIFLFKKKCHIKSIHHLGLSKLKVALKFNESAEMKL